MAAASSTRRGLHYVFKIGDRKATAKFYTDILGMKVLRHEEFDAGCEATCNGLYDGKWSKTMVGYGPEDDHFVCELTYNYGISTYKQGNSLVGLHLQGGEAVLQRARAAGLPVSEQPDGTSSIQAPGGYTFFVAPQPAPENKDPVTKVVLSSSNLSSTTQYWQGLLGLRPVPGPEGLVRFTCADQQTLIEFRMPASLPVDHAKAGGRVAFSCPSSELKAIEAAVRAAGHTVLTPFLSLDTPGKATVQVVILADPDGHEICFVGDEGFRELSRVDPAAAGLLQEAMAGDASDEWFAVRGGKGAQS